MRSRTVASRSRHGGPAPIATGAGVVRFVIVGAGAIGGLIGMRLHQSGHDVVLVARGASYERIKSHGLTLATPVERLTMRVPVVPTPGQAQLTADDVILLCTKSQHSAEALLSIRDAVPDMAHESVSVVCVQNGVANERTSLRLFRQTYGAVVLVPAEHLKPGYVVSYAGGVAGILDIGAYPRGAGMLSAPIASALSQAGFDSSVRDDIMVHKYAKLIGNLGNGVQVICGFDDLEGNRKLADLAAQEGRAVLTAAGIAHDASQIVDTGAAWEQLRIGEVDGHRHRGGSSWQSVTRRTGDVETDYLNGEIVLVGRTLGIPTPYNTAIQKLARATVRDGRPPGWCTASQVIAEVTTHRLPGFARRRD